MGSQQHNCETSLSRDASQRLVAMLMPSLVAAMLASVVTGLLDGALNAGSMIHGFVSVGFLSIGAIPLAFVIAVIFRLLWAAWEVPALLERLRDPGGGAPRFAAWLSFIFAAVCLLALISFNVVFSLMRQTQAAIVVALAASIAIVGVALLLLLLSQPIVRILTVVLRSRQLRWRRRREAGAHPVALWSPWPTLMIFLAVSGSSLWAVWQFFVEPNIGALDISFVYYIGIFFLVLFVTHVGWPYLRLRGRRALMWFAVGASFVSIACAMFVRSERQFTMLQVWANAELGGRAIDLMYDIQALRPGLHLPEVRPQARRPGEAHPNIVLITIDTLRADRTPPYGGPAKMPALRRFAKDALVFEWALSPGNVTRRSLPTIATGLRPYRVKGRVAGWALKIDPRHVLLAERFRAAGYETAGFFCCYSHFGPGHQLGLDRGIDYLYIQKDGTGLTDAAADWLKRRDREGRTAPLFLWVHLIEPHLWESKFPGKAGRNQKLRYDKMLAATDPMLDSLLREVWSPEMRHTTYVVLTSDHGEGLGDRGRKTHATNVYNSQVRVPLLVAGPGIEPRRVTEPVDLVTVAPTLLDLAGFVPPGMPHMDGMSRADLILGKREPRGDSGRAYSVMVKDRSVTRSMWALIVGQYKIVAHKDRFELYDVVRDPFERQNLAAVMPNVLKRMQQELAVERQMDAIPPF